MSERTNPANLATVTEASATLTSIEGIVERAKGYAEGAKSANTRRAYASDLRDFAAWCEKHRVAAFPATPQVVALYVTDQAYSKTVSTIQRRVVAIARQHQDAGHANPVADPRVRAILQGIRRDKGTAQRKKTALTGEHLRDVLLSLDASTVKGKRDRAILLLTFALAGRRSEIAALNVEDLRFEKSGLVVSIRRGKTDQTGEGREIGVPRIANEGLCAVRAVKAWLDAAEIKSGPLFRTFGLAGRGKVQPLNECRIAPEDVANLVKRVAKRAGIDGDFSAHSLRAGFITSAASAPGVREVDIQRVSGHRSEKILRSYVRKANVFTDAPLSAIFGK